MSIRERISSAFTRRSVEAPNQSAELTQLDEKIRDQVLTHLAVEARMGVLGVGDVHEEIINQNVAVVAVPEARDVSPYLDVDGKDRVAAILVNPEKYEEMPEHIRRVKVGQAAELLSKAIRKFKHDGRDLIQTSPDLVRERLSA